LTILTPREEAIMALQSRLFRDDRRLQECLVRDASHVTPGSVGDHVRKIQTALILLDDLQIDSREMIAKRYGPSTTAAVLAFKKARNIINFKYETQVDNIVGKMTIAALDEEMLEVERNPIVNTTDCEFGGETQARLKK
jgi:peptidoglycan hydrolase-like protein with peptidoglycan-binding domain